MNPLRTAPPFHETTRHDDVAPVAGHHVRPLPTGVKSSADLPWPFAGAPRRSPWRLAAAVGALTEAVGHIPVVEAHLGEAPYIGVGFVLLTVAGLVLAEFLLLADTTAVWTWTAIVSTTALTGYVLSRTVGLPQIRDDVGNWSEPLGIVCLAAETVMLAAAGLELLSRKRHRVGPGAALVGLPGGGPPVAVPDQNGG